MFRSIGDWSASRSQEATQAAQETAERPETDSIAGRCLQEAHEGGSQDQ